MFFRDLRSDIYPISSIEKMVFHKPPEENRNAGYYQVDLKGGGTCRISYEQADNLLRTAWKFVPAYPGVVLLEHKQEPSGNDPFHRVGVLAWALDEDGGLRAVTGEGVAELHSWAVLTPDGLVSDQFGSTFSSEEAYISSLNEDEG